MDLRREYDRPETAERIVAALAVDNPHHLAVEVRGREVHIRLTTGSASSARATLEDLLACLQVAERTVGVPR